MVIVSYSLLVHGNENCEASLLAGHLLCSFAPLAILFNFYNIRYKT